MFWIAILLEIIISILLTVAVLMQSSKGGGLAGTFGTGGMGTVFGVRRTADFLSKATQILATLFLLIALAANMFFLPGKTGAAAESILQREGAPVTSPKALPPVSQPAATPQQQQQPPQQQPPK
jgi:preprotein translocase subunit SecG